MKLLMALIVSCPSLVWSAWTAETPQRALLSSFDTQCATFKKKNGDVLKLKRDSLGDLKLEPRKTEIAYFEANTKNFLCK